MTVTTVREICRFCLALITVLMLWRVVGGIRGGEAAALLGTPARHGCSEKPTAPSALPRGKTIAPGMVRQ